MSILHDTATVGTAYTSTGSQTTSHAGSASAKYAVVLIDQNTSVADQVSGVTYGGVAMSRLRFDTEATEAGGVYIYVLANPPQGTQNVVMTTTGTANKQLVVATMTCASGKIILPIGFGNSNTSASGSNPSLTLSGLTASTPYVAYEVIHSGLTTMTTTPQSSPAWTRISSTDLGSQGRGFARIANTPSGSTLTAGWIAATADDYVISGVAFYESDPVPNRLAQNAGDSGTGSATLDLSVTIPSGVNTCLIVDLEFVPTVNPTSVVLDPSGANLSLTAHDVKKVTSATSTGRGVQRFYLVNPPAGTWTLRGTLSGVVMQTMNWVVYEHVDQTTPLGTLQSATATTGTSASCTAGGQGVLTLGGLGLRSTTAPTVGSQQTAVNAHQSSTNQQWYTTEQTDGSTTSFSWSTSDENVVIATVVNYSAGALTQALGVTTETDAAQALGRAKARAEGIATETDAAQTVGRSKVRALGTAIETDSAITEGRSKSRALGIATETDTALATPRKTGITAALGTATETDASQAVGRRKVRALGTASETEAAQTLGRKRSRALGIASETDAAQPLGRRKVKATTIPLEADASIALARSKLRLSNLTTETDAALAFGRMKAKALAIASESEAALPFTASGTQFATFVAHGGLTALTTTANVPYPSGLAVNDIILFFVNSIDSTISSDTPSGFTAGPTISGGSAGDTRLYYKVSNGTESGFETVTTTAGTKGRGIMAAYRPPAGKTLSVAVTYTGTDTTSDTVVSVDFSPVVAADKDTLVSWVAGAGDFTAGAFTGFNLADSAVTFANLGTRAAGRTGTNTAQHFLLDRNVVTGGTGTATATGTGNATGATGNGIAVLLRPTTFATVVALGTATETDAGQPLGRVRSRLLGIPLYAGGYGEGGYGEGGYGEGLSTSDIAMPMTRIDPDYLNTTIENDNATPVGRIKRRLLGVAVETDAAQHLAHGIIRSLGTAFELDSAERLTVRRSSIPVRIARADLPQPVDAFVDIGGYGATSRFQRALRRGSVVQRALLLTQPSPEHPDGLVMVTSDPSVVARWDAESVILDPAGIVLDNQSWQAAVLAANGYTLEAAP